MTEGALSGQTAHSKKHRLMTTDRPDLTTTEEGGLAIFAGGLLQWVTNETDEETALDELGKEIGEPDLKVHDFTFHYIPADEMEKWEDASAEHYPDIL